MKYKNHILKKRVDKEVEPNGYYYEIYGIVATAKDLRSAKKFINRERKNYFLS